MRLNEFTYELSNAEIDYNQVNKIRHLLGTDDKNFKSPVFKINNKIPKGTLAFCDWPIGKNQVEIHLRSETLKYRDKTLINRVIAHELCHEAEFFMYWLVKFTNEFDSDEDNSPARLKRLYKKWCDELKEADKHGEEFQKFADKVNSLIGPNYVTKTSDETYDTSLKRLNKTKRQEAL
jgi:predicted SprT family Zn-dependent metalloprotease